MTVWASCAAFGLELQDCAAAGADIAKPKMPTEKSEDTCERHLRVVVVTERCICISPVVIEA
jgi:hypothetical protein